MKVKQTLWCYWPRVVFSIRTGDLFSNILLVRKTAEKLNNPKYSYNRWTEAETANFSSKICYCHFCKAVFLSIKNTRVRTDFYGKFIQNALFVVGLRPSITNFIASVCGTFCYDRLKKQSSLFAFFKNFSIQATQRSNCTS